jgi:hypothetical protein
MCRKLFVFSIGLVVSIALKPILNTGQLNGAQQNDDKKNQLPPGKKNKATEEQAGGAKDFKKPIQPIVAVGPNPGQPQARQKTDNAYPAGVVRQSWSCFFNSDCRASLFSDVRPFEWGGLIIALFGLLIAIRALRATQVAADAARDSAEHVKLTDRAFLNIANWKFFGKDEDWIFQASIKNSGKTPATVIKQVTCWRLTPPELPIVPDYTLSDGSTGAATMIVGPGDQEWVFSLIGTKASIPFDIMAIERDKQTFFIYGLIEYRDAFGDTHKLGFGGRYMHPSGGFNRGDIPDGYNYAD